MALNHLTERIWVLPHDGRTDRPNLFYIRGDERSLAVDAGASPAHVQAFYSALEAERLPLPAVTVLTHWHWDHSFGLCAVEGETLSTEATARKLMEVQTWAWDRPSMLRREHTGEDIAFCNMHIVLEYGDPEKIRVALPKRTIAEDETLDLGGIEVQLLVRPSPHSEDSLLVYVPGEKVLMVGDANSHDFYDGVCMHREETLAPWVAFLESLDHRLNLHSHTDPCTKEEVLRHLRAKLEACRRDGEGRKQVEAFRGDYIPKMRRLVGHAPLMGTGCSVFVENEKGELLLQKRRDNGRWAPPGGAMNMGELAEETARREAWEEAGIVVGEMRLFGVYTGEERYIYYPNGDICYYTLLVFISNDYTGDPLQNTDEALEHRFFARDQLPDDLNSCDERSIRDWANGVSGVVCQ